ncbi:MAG: hypothetical protein ABSE82_11725 [Nitrososphaerales archaeon]
MGARKGIGTPAVTKKNGRRTGKGACKSVEQEENEKKHKKGLRRSWARIQMGNPKVPAFLTIRTTRLHFTTMTMSTTAEQRAFSAFCIGVVGILGNGLIGWQLGKKGFYQLGLEGPRNKKVIFAFGCFFVMVIWQRLRKLESPLDSWHYAWLPAFGILSWILARQLIPRSVRLYSRAKFLHETTYTGDWRSVQPDVPIAQVRAHPRLRKAEALYCQALEVQRSLAKNATAHAARKRHEQNEAVTYFQLTLLHLQRREFQEASKNACEGLNLAEKLRLETSNSSETASLLSDALYRSAETDQALGRLDEALLKYNQSLALDRLNGNEASARITEQRLAELPSATRAPHP